MCVSTCARLIADEENLAESRSKRPFISRHQHHHERIKRGPLTIKESRKLFWFSFWLSSSVDQSWYWNDRAVNVIERLACILKLANLKPLVIFSELCLFRENQRTNHFWLLDGIQFRKIKDYLHSNGACVCVWLELSWLLAKSRLDGWRQRFSELSSMIKPLSDMATNRWRGAQNKSSYKRKRNHKPKKERFIF